MGDRLGIRNVLDGTFLFFSLFSPIRPIQLECAVYLKCLGPYHVENTSSRPITEVKQH